MTRTVPTEDLIVHTRAESHARRLEALDQLAQRVFRKKELRHDPAVAEALLEALGSDDAQARYHASFGLQYIEGGEVTDACIAALSKAVGNSIDTNMQIVARLGKSKEPRALDALRETLSNLPKGMAKRPVHDAIQKLEAALGR